MVDACPTRVMIRLYVSMSTVKSVSHCRRTHSLSFYRGAGSLWCVATSRGSLRDFRQPQRTTSARFASPRSNNADGRVADPGTAAVRTAVPITTRRLHARWPRSETSPPNRCSRRPFSGSQRAEGPGPVRRRVTELAMYDQTPWFRQRERSCSRAIALRSALHPERALIDGHGYIWRSVAYTLISTPSRRYLRAECEKVVHSGEPSPSEGQGGPLSHTSYRTRSFMPFTFSNIIKRQMYICKQKPVAARWSVAIQIISIYANKGDALFYPSGFRTSLVT